ncbi:transcription activator acu-15 [Fusarium agapanthi]|uniref:Transcription activator acu-15 n=1 Tax=Fusarium agapanthi TaxID=1803897 RepID=A0A9P5B7A3_9HYPO|nr:transcription activator acu-15 [Fusarium agapanthi]
MLFQSVFFALLLSLVIVGTPTSHDHSLAHHERATCTPKSAGSASTDDVPAIIAAVKQCGNGGVNVFPKDTTYMIRNKLSFAGCINCEVQLEGRLKLSDDYTFWNNSRTQIDIRGIDGLKFHSPAGIGQIDGSGQAAWDCFGSVGGLRRPVMFAVEGSIDVEVNGFLMKNAQNIFVISDPTNDDDCVAVKAGCDQVTVTNITYQGSHGLSVGSLGKTNTDRVTNVYVRNATMKGATKAAGIKIYPGGPDHGTAVVRNVTWDGVIVDNCGAAFEFYACYNEDESYCEQHPSTAQVTEIYVKNFSGKTSTKYSPTTGHVYCPVEGKNCDVEFTNWTVKSETGAGQFLCQNISSDDLGITCHITKFRVSRTPRIKRNRPAVSCSTCRARKQKCDRQQPCGPCLKRGVQESCHLDSTPRPSPSSLANRGHSRVQNELRQMQSLLQSLLSQPNQDQAATSCDKLAAGVDRIRQAINDTTVVALQVGQTPDIMFGSLVKVTSQDVLAALPSHQESDKIVSTYLNSRHIAVPFIHVHQFRRQCEAFWNNPESANLLWASILFSVLAIGTIIPDDRGYHHQSSKFVSMSARCLVSGQYRTAIEFSVEALAMHLHARCFHQVEGEINLSQLHALTVRIAQQRGYHVDGDDFLQALTPFQVEVRRRVWYYLQYYDVLLSLEHGLPPVIHEDTYSMSHPTNITDDEFDEESNFVFSSPATEVHAALPCVYMSQLLPILRRIICHALGFKTCNYKDALLLKSQLETWYKSIPPCLRVHSVKDCCLTSTTFTALQGVLFQLIYNTGIALIYRPFLDILSLDNRYCKTALDASRLNALRSIEVYIEVDQDMQRGGRLYNDPQVKANLPVNDFFITMIMAPLEFFSCPNLPQSKKGYIIHTLETAAQLWPARSCVSSYALESSRLLRVILTDIYSSSSIERPMYPNVSESNQEIDLLQCFGTYESRNGDVCEFDNFLWNTTVTPNWVCTRIHMQSCATDET